MHINKINLNSFLKIIFACGFFIICCSIAYYFLISLPNESKREMEIKTQKELEEKIGKCLEDAKQFHEDYKKSLDGYTYEYFEQRYTYNKTIGRCLYSGGKTNKNNTLDNIIYWERFVKDIYTNENIIFTWSGQGSDYISDFWNKHDVLFDNN